MTDNIAAGPEANLNYALQILRDSQASGDIAEHSEIQPGITLHADPALKARGQWRSPAGRLLELEVTAGSEGSWFGLHMDLGGISMSQAGLLGIACRSTAPSIEAIRACIRSGRSEGGFDDCFFTKRILAHPEASSHLDALQISLQPDLPPEAPWRELILFLPAHSFRLDLHDLRLFIV
ncbi:hypothetical protein [Leisingera sp. F5]|uniref:hypothetical protein n=1 Tax=Leisingera sp. F5 TaxID=1813816 RepID=UPI000A430B14|nr:hypothetical protein [Leisingera sp. F5]